jgi:hypothetical protein
VPEAPDLHGRYVFYLRGRILEVQGRNATSPDFGRYDYDGILRALAGRGLQVISEVRSRRRRAGVRGARGRTDPAIEGGRRVVAPHRCGGRVFSIHDDPDRFSPSCRETFDAARRLTASRETVLRLGVDHGLVYRPRPEWVDRAVEWLTAADDSDRR